MKNDTQSLNPSKQDVSNVELLKATSILDYEHASIQTLIEQRDWRSLGTRDAISEVYLFVRDEIRFGYNRDDSIPASRVLADGYGQCNTKGSLLMALLRALGIACRFHGFTIFNELQKGAIPLYLFRLAPERIIHSWVEVEFEGKWLNLEGFIIDKPYLLKVQQAFSECHDFQGYGIATTCLAKPQVDWDGGDTYIQKEGIADDFGVYAQPDDFYRRYGSNLCGAKKWLFRYLIRHLMNANVQRIRARGLTGLRRGVQTNSS